MPRRFSVGDCVRVPDGRIGRVRAIEKGGYRVRLQRRTSKTHQFMVFRAGELAPRRVPRRVDEPRRISPLPEADAREASGAAAREKEKVSGLCRIQPRPNV